jgi:hypothetical protein
VCEGEYLTGSTITVQAQASPGYVLEGWTGCDSIIGESCMITVNNDMTTIAATFLPPPRLTLGVRSLKFGSLKKGSQSLPQTVIVQNTGVAKLSISSLEVGGDHGNDFSFVNGCSSYIPAGGSCTIDVAATPSEYGKRLGELRITTNDPKKRPFLAIKMTGNAIPPKINVKPSSLRFEPVALGGQAATKTIVIENKGRSDLAFDKVYTGDVSDFLVTNNCPSMLEGGTSCTMELKFQPSNIGQKEGLISINTNDPKKPSVMVKYTGKAE